MRSTTVLISFFLIFLLSFNRLSLAQHIEPCLAVITELKGDVTIRKSAKTTEVKGYWGSQLFQGDQVSTSANSEAELTLRNNSIIKLGSNSTITVASNAANTEKRGNVQELSYNAMIDFQTLAPEKNIKPESGALAGFRSVGNIEESIKLNSPMNSRIKTTRPSFTWTASGTFENYTVYLNNKNVLAWKKTVTSGSMNYPEDEKELEPGGSYNWYVEGNNLSSVGKSDNHSFSVLSAERLKQITEQENAIFRTFPEKQETETMHSLLGAYYVYHGLLQDAINQFQIISELNTDSPVPHEILASIYIDAGDKEKASEELKKASFLRSKDEKDF